MISFCITVPWSGLGPGKRGFQTSIAIGLSTSSGRGNEVFGRVLFGGVGLLCSLGAALYAVKQPGKIIRGEFNSLFDQNQQSDT
jgi:hypothetical protein